MLLVLSNYTLAVCQAKCKKIFPDDENYLGANPAVVVALACRNPVETLEKAPHTMQAPQTERNHFALSENVEMGCHKSVCMAGY